MKLNNDPLNKPNTVANYRKQSQRLQHLFVENQVTRKLFRNWNQNNAIHGNLPLPETKKKFLQLIKLSKNFSTRSKFIRKIDPSAYYPICSEISVRPDLERFMEYRIVTKIRDGHNSHIKIVEKTKKELALQHIDQWPLFQLRRMLSIFFCKLQYFTFLFIKSKIFEYASLTVIMTNTLFMIISDPLDTNSILNQSETFFFVIYTVELSLKLLGLGLFTKKIGFFRSGWNILDFIIVGGSLLSFSLTNLNINLSSLRSLRVLRPLKTVSSVKSLKNIIVTIFSSLPYLKDILIILFFFLVFFGITGLHLFHGVFHSVCYDPTNNTYPLNSPISQTGYCSEDANCPGLSLCLNTYKNPFYEQTSFDNVLVSILMVFQSSTTENWSWMLYSLSPAFSSVFQIIILIYFVLIIVLLNFVIGNLMLAVIVVKFNEAHDTIEKDTRAVQHSEFCNCNTGFNYAQMKSCGYFLSLSHLKKNPDTDSHKIFIYDLTKSLKEPNSLLVDPEFRFLIIETIYKPNEAICQKIENKEFFGNSLALSQGFRRKRTIGNRAENPQKKLSIKNEKFSTAKCMIESKFFKTEKFPSEIQEQKEFEKDLEMKKSKKKPDEDISIPSSASYSFEEKKFTHNEVPENYIKTQILKKESIMTSVINKNEIKEEDFQKQRKSLHSDEFIVDGDYQSQFITNLRKGKLGSELGEKRVSNSQRRKINTKFCKFEENKDEKSFLEIPQNKSDNFLESPDDKMKVEMEFKNFAKFRADMLKLDFDYCKQGLDLKAQELQKSVMPSIEKARKTEEESIKREKRLKSKIEMYFNPKYIGQSKHKNKKKTFSSEDEFSDSVNNTQLDQTPMPFETLNFKSVTIRKDSNNKTKINKARKRLLEHMAHMESFYFYLLPNTCHVTNLHERLNCGKGNQESQKMNAIVKMKPAVAKHRSKNFSTIAAFFNEEFESREGKNSEFLFNANEFLLNGLLQDSIKKQRVIHTNWSGFDILEQTPACNNRTSLIFDSLNTEIYEMWLEGALGKFNIMRRYIRQFFALNQVELFLIALVLLNTVILSLDGLVTNTVILNEANIILTMIFAVEFGLKLIGLGPINFHQDWFNVFDGGVAITSVIEVAIGSDSQILSAVKVIRVLRTIRVLRVSRILRNLKFMRTLIKIFQITFEQFLFTTLLLLLFLTIFSLIGMQFYAGTWTFIEPGEVITTNYESFSDAFLSMVDIMSIVNWNDTLVLLARSSVNYLISCFYLIIWIFIGNYILLNLFIAVLLDGFSSAVKLNKLEDLNNEFEGIEIAAQEELEAIKTNLAIETEKAEKLKAASTTVTEIEKKRKQIHESIISNYLNTNQKDEEEETFIAAIVPLKEDSDVDMSVSSEKDIGSYIFKNARAKKSSEEIFDSIYCPESLFLFSEKGLFRKILIKIVSNPWFENFILFVIFLSSLHLIVETYRQSNWTGGTLDYVLSVIDYTVNAIFILESLMKIIAFGFFWCEGSYLRDPWSVLDFIIVLSSIFDMMVPSSDASFLGVLKIMRSLRPLRVLSHNPNLKIVVLCLIQSLTGILNVAVVVLMVWLMYSILGMNLLMDRLSYCSFSDARSYFYVNQTMCPELGGIWKTRGCNFENIFSAMSAMFVFSNSENWNAYTYEWMDGDIPSVGPSYKAYWPIQYFAIVIIFTSTFFLTKLFIGVIYSEFITEQEKLNRKQFKIISDDQIRWIQMQKMIKAARPNYVEVIIPRNPVRRAVFRLVESPLFEWFIMGMIFMNFIALAMFYEDQNPLYARVLEYFGFFFTGVFILEAILKIFALGIPRYLDSGWNIFDFSIVLISILDLILTHGINLQGVSIYPLIGRIMRIMRVTRIFKMLKSKSLEGINKIVKTLFYSVPAILNVTLVLFLVYFIYSILGVFLFKKYDPAFANFTTALLFMFKCSTGESWPDNMYEAQEYSLIAAIFYWHTYLFLTTFTLINLFMSVIIDQFNNFYFHADNPINSFEEIVEEFRTCWLLFTSKQKGERIQGRNLTDFFICLKSPLGFHIPQPKESAEVYGENFKIEYFKQTLQFSQSYVIRKVSEMKLLEDKDGFVSFGQVLHATLRNAFGKNCYKNTDNDTFKEIKRIELKTVAKIFNKHINNYDIQFVEGEQKAKIKAKASNPFNNLLFSQMLFQIWYNNAKNSLDHQDSSSEDLQDLLNKNADRQFAKQVLGKTRENLIHKMRQRMQKKQL